VRWQEKEGFTEAQLRRQFKKERSWRLWPIAWGLGVLCLAAFGASIYHQAREVEAAQDMVENFEFDEIGDCDEEGFGPLHNVACRQAGEHWDGHSSSWFQDAEQSVGRQFAQKLRENVLLPALASSQFEVQSFGTLYAIGLLYASYDNALGQLIRENAEIWSEKVGLPVDVIMTYLSLAKSEWDGHLSQDMLAVQDRGNAEDWDSFFQQLDHLISGPHVSNSGLAATRQSAQDLIAQSRAMQGDALARATFLHLRELPQANIAQLFDRQIRTLEWVAENENEIDALIDLMRRSQDYAVPISDFDLATLSEQLWEIQHRAQELEEGEIVRLRFGPRTEEFQAGEWNSSIARERGAWLLREYLASQSGHPTARALFAKDAQFAPVKWQAERGDASLFVGEAEVDGIFTPIAFKRAVVPTVDRVLDAALSLGLDLALQKQLQEHIEEAVAVYAQAYRAEYEKVLLSYRTEAESENRLRILLKQLQDPKFSALDELLELVAQHTDLPYTERDVFQQVQQELEVFAFVGHLRGTNDAAFSALEGYTRIVARLDQEVSAPQPVALPDARIAHADALNERLTPLGQISFAILRENTRSYWQQISDWMDVEGVPPHLRQPFLEPIDRVLELGLDELSIALGTVWEEQISPMTASLLGKFPFNPEARQDVTVSEITQLLGPDSRFWTQVEALARPFCDQGRHCEPFVLVKGHEMELPYEMACVLGKLARIRQSLWDEHGQPMPLTVSVRPLLPRTALPIGQRVALGFLHAGKKSVYGLRSATEWQELSINWWNEDGATVGLTLMDQGTQSKSHRRLEVERSPWSMLRLIQRATASGEDTFTWQLRDEAGGAPVEEVPFALKGDLIDLFRMDCPL
jgi:hypothetical protein